MLLLSALLAAAPPVGAAEVEIEARVGQTLPAYSQSFSYDPGQATLSIPGLASVRLQQRGAFVFDGKGGSSIGASLTVYPARGIGIELRIDSASVDIATSGAVYHVSADLPAPLPSLATDVALASGTVDVGRLKPLSLDLKLRSGGRVGVAISGGLSYLPTVRLSADQPIGLGATGFDPGSARFNVGTIGLHAEVRPESDDTAHRIGGNIGAGLRIEAGGHVSVTAEARLFHFPRHELQWTPIPQGPLSSLEQALLDEVTGRIDPIDFNPTFYQATAGLAVRF